MSEFLGAGPLADPTGARAAAVMIKYAAPGVVIESHPDDLFGVIKVAANFADRNYEYPTHTPAATWTSLAAYHDSGSTDAIVASRIKLACDYHRLWGEWDRVAKMAEVARTSSVKKASVKRWALPTTKKYPLDTPEQVKAAHDYFVRYADSFPDTDRKTFAAETAKAAGEVGWVETKDQLQHLEAEGGLCRATVDPTRPFLMRAKYAAEGKLDELAVALTKAAEDAGKDPVADAAILRRIDRRMGWPFGNPITETTGETASAVREKIASAARAVSGNWYAMSDLERVSPAFISAALGAGPVVAEPAFRGLLSDAVKSAAFEKILQDAGIRPVSAGPAKRTDWSGLATQSS